jgi:hypothetical protein
MSGYRLPVQGPQMRPLGFGEIFDVAIKIFWRHAGTLMTIVAFVIVPVQILSSLILLSTFPEPDLLGGSMFQPPTPTEPTEIITGEDLALMFAGVIVVWVISFIATALATGASYKAVGDAYLGTKPEWRSSLKYGLRRMHSVAWVTFLSTITLALIFVVVGLVGFLLALIEAAVGITFVIGGFIGAIVLAIWLWAAWSVAIPALLTEDARGSKALTRSFRLVKGGWWRTFGLVFLGYLGAAFVSGIISTVPQIVLLTDVGDSVVASLAISGLGSALASVLTTPFIAALVTVLYFDLRVKKEGFDLQLLAYRIGTAAPTELPEALRPPAPVVPPWPQNWGQPQQWPPPPPPPGWGNPQAWPAPPQTPPAPPPVPPPPAPPAPEPPSSPSDDPASRDDRSP